MIQLLILFEHYSSFPVQTAKPSAEATPGASTASLNKEDAEWIEVKRRGRERLLSTSSSGTAEIVVEDRRGTRSRQTSLSISKPAAVASQPGEDREELDFQFDEEFDRPLPGVKQHTFTEWSDSEDSECDEVGDDFINKVCKSM